MSEEINNCFHCQEELKHLQEQWKILKDFPENYPTWAETKKRKEELENKYSNNNPNPNREGEQFDIDQLKQYFQKYCIKFFILKDNGSWLIEYTSGEQKEFQANADDTALQEIKAYCQQKNLKTLSVSDLQQNPNTESKLFNWKSLGVIGTGLVLVVGIIGLVVYFTRKNKE